MHKVVKLALAAGLVVACGTAARADVDVRNDNDHSVWYTVYNMAKTGLAHGCLQNRQGVHLNSPLINASIAVYVRGEVKANKDCSGNTRRDTSYGPRLPVSSVMHVTRTMATDVYPDFN